MTSAGTRVARGALAPFAALGQNGPRGKAVQPYFLYDDSAKRFYEVNDGMVCGRMEGDIQFAFDDVLSRRHCQFRINKGEVYVMDLNSTNRTIVNNAPVQARFSRRAPASTT